MIQGFEQNHSSIHTHTPVMLALKTCAICMEEKTSFVKCCECRNEVCTSCFHRCVPKHKCPFCRELPMNPYKVANDLYKLFSDHVFQLTITSQTPPSDTVLAETLHVIFKHIVYFKFDFDARLKIVEKVNELCEQRLKDYVEYKMDESNAYTKSCNTILSYINQLCYYC
jgi:hypothetical protein